MSVAKIAISIDDQLLARLDNFITQKKFNNCRNKLPLPFDFYLPNYNICIEFDGIQHFKSNFYWGGDKQFLKTSENDKIKNNFCKRNNIKLERISYKKFNQIEKIITKLIMT